MAWNLVSCSSCARHIRRSETACPFCGELLVETSPSTASAARPLTRAAILLASAAAVAGCGKEPKAVESDGTTDAGFMIAAPYGVPMPFDAGGNIPPPPPTDTGMMVAPAYGVAPPPAIKDAGKKK